MSQDRLPDEVYAVLRKAIIAEIGQPSRLTQRRRAKGKTGLRELAARAGIPASAVSRFIHGERGLSLDYATALAAALGYDLRVTLTQRK